MATLDNAIWLTGASGEAQNGSTVITDGANSTTVTGTFTGNWDDSQSGYNVSEFGAFGVTSNITANYEFSEPVENLSFDFEHVNGDEVNYDDSWTIYAYDENGDLIDSADIIASISGLDQDVVYANPDGSVTIESEGGNANNVSFNYSGQISEINLTFAPGPDAPSTGGSGITDFSFDIPDTTDTDGDGVPDSSDVDTDGDGILDVDEGAGTQTFTVTVDGDFYSNTEEGEENSWEILDSNGNVVASGTVTDSGVQTWDVDLPVGPDYTFRMLDSYGDGLSWTDDDSNSDAGFSLSIDGTTVLDSSGNPISSTGYEDFGFEASYTFDVDALDSDGDGIADYLDLDSDNDGITDNVEAQTSAGYVAPTGVDTDGDGLDDAYETGGLTPVDTDGDGIADYLDTDSDNDGILDVDEAGHGVDQATIDASGDSDGDGIMDAVDDVVGWDVNDDDVDGSGNLTLDDTDGDAAVGGDYDFRDDTNNNYIVEGTAGDDLIDASYTGDPDGDFVDNNDALDGSNDDVIVAGAGNDTVIAGSGNDDIDGGTGNDTIYGDEGPSPVTSASESLNWSSEGADETDLSAGFTQTTGQMDVSVSFSNDGGGNDFSVETSDTAYTEAGEPFDPNSNLSLGGTGSTPTSTTTIDFSSNTTGVQDEVENVTFRISELDSDGWQDIVTINAYDADGNLVTVTIDPNGTDTVSGNTITSGIGSEGWGDQDASALVTIAGPLSKIEIIYENGGTSGQLIGISDIHYDTVVDTIVPGDDVIDGGEGDDIIYGQGGDDTLTGGEGADELYGGEGDDTINFGVNDTAEGGLGDDTFILDPTEATGGPGVVINIDGNEDPDDSDVDTLYLSGLATHDDIVYDPNDPESGTVTLSDGTVINFTNIENVIICFTTGSMILTDRGERPVEDLKTGDMVVTRDHGLQPIRWIGQKATEGHGKLAPILIQKGAFGNHSDLIVSPQHRMVYEGPQANLLFAQPEVMIPAVHLLQSGCATQTEVDQVTYFHIMFDQHEVIFANGAATESFHPGHQGLGAIDDASRAELFTLFPELRSEPRQYGDTARMVLKGYEARVLDLTR
ncbi:Hint domain-containing protein [Aliiroseovarius sp. F20344]|uniref:Hint domain-containing protein n=1 Tax=Aliiroseovarius sp. F20344 TaxID=2926414 RepID=UPI001FF184E7|nr:Hint domain-containing protein [Aliiroseovarius sp. F20344]MCK0143450.1 Hint domain-containing protein [Aliiroseovarius sp. F20344]